jgi:phage-related protein
MSENYKELIFLGDTEDFISSLDWDVRRQIGYALWEAQTGKKAPSAKPLGGIKEFKGGKVLEIVTDGDGDTYRTVYTVEFKEAIYVVDAFQKKSKKGIATPQADIDRIVQRVKALRNDRERPETKARIEQLLVRRAYRQQIIDDTRRKKNDPK